MVGADGQFLEAAAAPPHLMEWPQHNVTLCRPYPTNNANRAYAMISTSLRLAIALTATLIVGQLTGAGSSGSGSRVPVLSQALQQPVQEWPHMVDRGAIDSTCAPCADFYTYANGGWIKRTTLPAGRAFLSPLLLLGQRANAVIQALLEEDTRRLRLGSVKLESPAGLVGAFFASCMDTAAIARSGYRPFQATLDSIAAIQSPAALARAFALPVAGLGQRLAPFWIAPAPDPRNSNMVLVRLSAGTPLDPLFSDPRRQTDSVVAAYIRRSRQALVDLGVDSTQAEIEARADFKLSQALARVKPALTELQDPRSNTNLVTFVQLTALTPHFPWKAYYQAAGIPQAAPINIELPTFYTRLDSLFGSVSLADWRAWLRLRLLTFRTLTQSAASGSIRGRECTSQVANRLSRAIAREYAQRELTPARQRRLDDVAANLVAVLHDRIQRLEWMSTTTRQAALAKLPALRRHLGAPRNLATYEGLHLQTDDYFGNLTRIEAHLQRESWASVGRPVDRDAWRIMPHVANAAYWPESNELGIPAAILFPPFFDPAADDAANYGALGSIIAHELTHAFDNNGRRYDPAGNLRDWWTPEDDAMYTKRTNPLIAQFDAYLVVDTATRVRGQQTLNENIADLGGAILAYEAFQRATRDRSRTVIDGFTPEQRFFIALAQTGAEVRRSESRRQEVLNGWHAPSQWRVNGVLSNMPEFAKAWGCSSNDAMVRADALRPRIW